MSTDPNQTTARRKAEWYFGVDRAGAKSLTRELWWMLWHGTWDWGWNRDGLIFGVGRTWYDGPIWFAHFGFVSCSLVVV